MSTVDRDNAPADRNSRRYFLDVDTDGHIILSAPNRTAFDSFDRNRMHEVGRAKEEDPFVARFDFGGLTYRVEVTCWPLKKT